MIVRILGEGQFDVADSSLDELNRLDQALEAAVGEGDEDTFRSALEALLDGVRRNGAAHDAESLDESDLILPPADASIEDVRELLSESSEGLIPG